MTVTGALNNVIDNFSALLLRKRLTSLFLSRKAVSGKPSRKQETISTHGRGVIPLKGAFGVNVYLWHLSDWKEDIINIKLGLLNEALHSYNIYTFITRYGLPLAFGWWLTSRTFAFGVFTTFTLIWKEKLVILLGKKFMCFNDGDCKILSSLFGFYIPCLFTTTTSSYENEHGGPISTKAGLHTQNCIVSARKDANILISFFCKEKKKKRKQNRKIR